MMRACCLLRRYLRASRYSAPDTLRWFAQPANDRPHAHNTRGGALGPPGGCRAGRVVRWAPDGWATRFLGADPNPLCRWCDRVGLGVDTPLGAFGARIAPALPSGGMAARLPRSTRGPRAHRPAGAHDSTVPDAGDGPGRICAPSRPKNLGGEVSHRQSDLRSQGRRRDENSRRANGSPGMALLELWARSHGRTAREALAEWGKRYLDCGHLRDDSRATRRVAPGDRVRAGAPIVPERWAPCLRCKLCRCPWARLSGLNTCLQMSNS